MNDRAHTMTCSHDCLARIDARKLKERAYELVGPRISRLCMPFRLIVADKPSSSSETEEERTEWLEPKPRQLRFDMRCCRILVEELDVFLPGYPI
jgi:hypothetical protein